MTSEGDWTHQWLMTSMGPSTPDEMDEDAEIHNSGISFSKQFHDNDPSLAHDPLGINQSHADDEPISTSPVTSIDLERDSPMACEMDDDDVGPPSVETQPADNSDLEISGITSSWIKSGDSYENGCGVLSCSPITADMVPSSSEHDMGSGSLSVKNEENFEVPNNVPGPLCVTYHGPLMNQEANLRGDVAGDTSTGGLCGLRNLGNTCFMAAGLQCLVNTPPIAQYFFNHNLGNESGSTLAGSFSQLTHKIWSGKYSSVKPLEFKEAFGAQWRDFRDYRQHDCQEFMTLLLEGLRKQMLVEDQDLHELGIEPMDHESKDVDSSKKPLNEFCGPCTSRSVSSSSSNSNMEGSRESRASLSPSPPQSPREPPSPVSPDRLQAPYETRSDTQEDALGLDSGPGSPKSSISSGSVDAHLISLRLQPIPEEVKTLGSENCRVGATGETQGASAGNSFPDAESVTSDDGMSVSSTGGGHCRVAVVRKYNHLTGASDPDNSISSTSDNAGQELTGHEHCLTNYDCDTSKGSEPSSMDDSNGVSTSSPPECQVKGALGLPDFIPPRTANHLSMVKLEDIMKETKTSNVNVLAKDNLTNEFLYDSEKYAKSDLKRINNSVDNLNRSGLKRVKEVNILVDKMDNSQLDPDVSSKLIPNKSFPSGRNSIVALNKRIRLEEKNVQYEKERNHSDLIDRLSDSLPVISKEGPETSASFLPTVDQQSAKDSWKLFEGANKSAVVDTFYGQFRSSLVCSVCGYTSVRFDPFGTLSVPLPHANEIQVPVIYVPCNGDIPTRYLLTLFKVSTVQNLKQSLLKLIDPDKDEKEERDEKTIVIAEVFDNHIARTVDETYSTKFLNTSTRSIYAFEVPPQPLVLEQFSSKEDRGLSTVDKDASEGNSEPSTDKGTVAQWQACNICLEELCQTDLKTHDSCEDCVLCDNCIDMSCKHHGGHFLPCPVCHTKLEPSELIPVVNRRNATPKARILRVPVVFRIDTESDDNNKREMQLTGHPCLLSLPSRIQPETLVQSVKRRVSVAIPFSLLLVDGRGYNCSRCLFSSHCRGCDITKNESEVVLQAGDTLCVRFKQISSEQVHWGRLQDHHSMSSLRPNEPLTLYDCLRAFTQSEVLRENESWFCPECNKKQHATKQISVWKFPPYLIIHLERFLFHGTTSVKLDDKVLFPIDGLELTDFVSGEQQSPLLYNLYSCVCHMGVAQAGHYTALVRSPVTGEWHYFNDDCVTRQKPRDEEYSTSYLLFYHRQGAKFDLNLPQKFSLSPSKLDLDPKDVGVVYGPPNDPSKSLPSVSNVGDAVHEPVYPTSTQPPNSPQPVAGEAHLSPIKSIDY